MQLAFRQLKTSFALLREAAEALRVTVTVDRPRESHALVDKMQDCAGDLAGCLESAAAALREVEATPFDRSGIRTSLLACQEALEHCDAPCRELAATVRDPKRGGEWSAWTRCVEEQAGHVVVRVREAQHALGVSWCEFTEPGSSAAGCPPEDAFLDTTLVRTFDWYKQADAKAQAILAFTGVFLAILVGSVVLKAETVLWKPGSPMLNLVGVGTVLSLYLAGAFLCVLALWSRGMGSSHADIYFFGDIANLPDDGPTYVSRVRRALDDRPGYQSIRATEVLILSRNTRRKHRLVNAAVVCSSSALVGTVAMGMLLAFR